MKKYLNRKFIVTQLVATFIIIVATVMVYEQKVRTPMIAWWNSDTITIARDEVEQVEEKDRITILKNTPRAVEACQKAQLEEAKIMRLDEIAEEAKELQASLM